MSKLDYETVRARRAGLTRALDGFLVNAADHGFTGGRSAWTRCRPLRPPSCWLARQAEPG
jgi:hypothetical protein